jgi:excisionase family DNA binding protein
MFSFNENAFKQIIREALVEVLENFEFSRPASETQRRVEFLSVKEVEKLLKISHSTLYALVRAGKLNPVKLGRRTLFNIKEIEQIGEGNDANSGNQSS